jgi:DNA polymerase III epsilon subunit-like protein
LDKRDEPKMICVFDLESTGLHTSSAEIVQGHFICTDHDLNVVGTFDLKCRPRKWSYEAQEIHGITKDLADTYRPYSQSHNELMSFLRSNNVTELWMHTNPNSYGKRVHFDYAILKNEVYDISTEDYFYLQRMKVYSTHTLAKCLHDRFNFDKLSLDQICKELKIKLNHHDCVSDANACLEIMRKLLPLTTRENLGEKYDSIGYDCEKEKPQKRNTRISKRKHRLQI